MATVEPLTVAECWDRLRSHRVGRIGFDRGRGKRIHPVNYVVESDSICLMTSRESELGVFSQLFSEGALVPFEIDQLDQDLSEQWSVLVLGHLRAHDNDGDTTVPPNAESRPPDGHDELILWLTPVEVTGRRRPVA